MCVCQRAKLFDSSFYRAFVSAPAQAKRVQGRLRGSIIDFQTLRRRNSTPQAMGLAGRSTSR